MGFDETVGAVILREELAEANVRAGEAEQFLNYATNEQIREHRSRVRMSLRSGFTHGTPHVPMPYIENGQSVWNPPAGLLDSKQVRRLQVGSVVRWVGDRHPSGERRHVRPGYWAPAIGDGDFYWLISQPGE